MEKGPVFGLSIGELLTIYDHDSRSWKMSGCLFTGDYAKSSGPLRKSGMMRNGKIYEQATWAPRTGAKESGLWPTPRANDAEKRGNIANDPRNGLPAAVKFPTPQVFDATCGDLKGKEYNGETRHAMKLIQAVKRFPTPHSNCHTGPGKRGENLQTAVKNFPTPRANKPEGYSSNGFRPTLAQIVTGEDKPLHGQLNPTWVDWLMGYPIGWTDCADSEMRLSLK